jgi:hypothetical protein
VKFSLGQSEPAEQSGYSERMRVSEGCILAKTDAFIEAAAYFESWSVLTSLLHQCPYKKTDYEDSEVQEYDVSVGK